MPYMLELSPLSVAAVWPAAVQYGLLYCYKLQRIMGTVSVAAEFKTSNKSL